MRGKKDRNFHTRAARNPGDNNNRAKTIAKPPPKPEPPPPTKDGPGWLTAKELQPIFFLGSPRTGTKMRQQLERLPEDARSTRGGVAIYSAAAVHLQLVNEATKATRDHAEKHYRAKQPGPAADPIADPEGLFMSAAVGGNSPALERFRLARAKSAEMDLAERQKETIRRGDVHKGLRRISEAMRRTGDRIKRSGSQKALEIFNEGLDDIERAAREEFGNGGEKSNDGGDGAHVPAGTDSSTAPNG